MESDYLDTAFRRKLNGVRIRGKAYQGLKGLAGVLSVAGGLGFFLVIAEWAFGFSPAVRTALVFGGAVAIGLWMVNTAFIPFLSIACKRNEPDDAAIAAVVGQAFPRIGDRLANAIQVYDSRAREKRTSSEMAQAALERMDRETAPLDFNRVVSFRILRSGWIRTAVIWALASAAFLAFPKPLIPALHRLLHPFQAFPRPSSFHLGVSPGDVVLVQGEPLEIRVQATGRAPSQIVLIIREEGDKPFAPVLAAPFHYRLEAVRRNLEYHARSGNVRSSIHRITVLERPQIRKLRVTLHPPDYSGRRPVVLDENVGDIEALRGTTAAVWTSTNKTVRRADAVFENGRRYAMETDGKEATGRFPVVEDGYYRIELEDHEGLCNDDAIRYAVRVLPDGYPSVRLVSPESEYEIDERMAVPLVVEAEDDFGVSRCRLRYWTPEYPGPGGLTPDTPAVWIPFPEKNPTHLMLRWTWSLESVGIMPEDVVSYRVEAADNDPLTGPKWAKSPVQTVRFPSLQEIYQEVAAAQDRQIESLAAMQDEGNSLREDLEKLDDRLKAGEDVGWEGRKELENKTGRQNELEEEIQALKRSLDETIQKLERNDLLGMETLEKYQELQKLYEEIATPELLEAMRRFQESLKRIDPNELKSALARLQLSEKAFLQSIERTMDLLKRIRIEQKTDELIKRLQTLEEMQDGINRRMEGNQNLSDLVAGQEEIRKGTDDFREEAERLRQDMADLPGMPIQKMDRVLETERQAGLEGVYQDLKQRMVSGQFREARSQGSRAVQSMQQVEQALRDMKQDLLSRQNERMARAFRKTTHDVLRLSQSQESLARNPAPVNGSGTDAAERQMALSENVGQIADSLFRLSRESFLVTPEMGRLLGEARGAMQQALERMGASDGSGARPFQDKAVGALNRTVAALIQAMDDMASGTGSGMEQFFLQMQRMGEDQARWNRELADRMQGGRLTLEDQAVIARLAAEQETLKKRLESLLQEFGNRAGTAGRLERLIEDMEQTIQELRGRKVNPETIQRQERILSRLLDAQASLYKQDYSAKRQSRTGQDVVRRSPAPGPRALGVSDRYRKDLLELEREGYTRDYLELIERYFKAMSRTEGE